MDQQELLWLIDRYLDGTASEEEAEQLQRYYDSFQQERKWNEAALGSTVEMEEKLLQRVTTAIHENSKPAKGKL